MSSCTTKAEHYVVFPERLGQVPETSSFGLSQLTLTHRDEVTGDLAYGNMFEATPIPVIDFARHLDFLRPVARRLLHAMRPAMLVGNAFLSCKHTKHTMRLSPDGRPVVRGGYCDTIDARVRHLHSAVAKTMRRCGVVVMPGSFRLGDPGGDVHYAGTLPMSNEPEPWQTDLDGEVAALPGLHVVDGACLPVLPVKAHTLTIMANADRIGRRLAEAGGKTT